MADADTRLKRQSATCVLLPQMLSGVYPDTAGVVQTERQAVTWMYSGILAGSASGIVIAAMYLYRGLMQGDNL